MIEYKMKYNINELIKVVSDEMPCGSDLTEETDYYILEELASEKEDTQFAEAEQVEWGKVEQLSLVLLSRSKDLWIIHYFISSLFRQYKLKGICDGIQLLHNTVTEYWENIYPLPDEDYDDPSIERINILKTIFNRNSTLCKSLLEINISKSKLLGMFSYKDYLIATGKMKSDKSDKSTTKELIIGAVKESDESYIEELKSNLTDVSVNIGEIKTFFDANGIDDSELSESIEGFLSTVHSIAKDVESISTENNDDLDEGSTGAEKENQSNKTTEKKYISGSSIQGYSDIIKLLEIINEWYKNNEPASPVPLFLDRAQSLVGKDFISIISDVAASASSEINALFKLEPPLGNNDSMPPNSLENHELANPMMPPENFPPQFGSGENEQSQDQFPYTPNNEQYKY